MVEIKYGEHYEVADLAGKSVAEVREQYKEEFGIPDKAQASLDGKGIRKKLEPKIELNDDAELSFAEKSRRGLFFIGAMVLAIAITSGIFAYTYTTATLTLAATPKGEFAEVIKDASPPSWPTVWNRWKGVVPPGDLFDITPEATYTGDLVVKVYLTNQASLVTGYQHLNIKLQLWDDVAANHGTAVNMTDWQNAYADTARFELLTMENGMATFALQGYTAGNTYYIYSAGGTFQTQPWKAATAAGNLSPDFFCEVIQSD